MMQKRSLKFLSCLIGGLFGIVIAHPYIMLVYVLTGPDSEMQKGLGLDFTRLLTDTFSEKMLPMTAAFSFFCAVIGFMLGLIIERNARLNRMKFQMEKREAVTTSMQKLLAVLSHFILNSTLVIQARVRQIKKGRLGKKTTAELSKIEEQAKRNEEVLMLMKDYKFLKNIEDSDRSLSQILELSRNIEERIIK